MQPNELAIEAADKNNKIEVDGEKVPVKHFRFFLDVMEGMDLETAYKVHNISRATYYRLTEKEWWNKLITTYLKPAQDRLTVGLSQLVPQMLQTAEDILRGEFKEPKMAGPAAKLIENFQKVGFKRGNVVVTPMQHSMRDLYLQEFNITKNEETNVTINIDMLADKLTKEEMLDYALGKGLPDHVINEIKQKAEDATYTALSDVQEIPSGKQEVLQERKSVLDRIQDKRKAQTGTDWEGFEDCEDSSC